MKISSFLLIILLFFVHEVYGGDKGEGASIAYDYSYVLVCVAKPEPPLYGGGIIINPEFDDGLTGWDTAAGTAEGSPDGNAYAVVSDSRTELPADGLFQTINVVKGQLYTLSAWYQLSEGEAGVYAELATTTRNILANFVTAKAGCWTMLKGGFQVDETGPARLRFAPNTTGFDMWVDSISVQPFTQEEWTNHQAQSVEKVRKGEVKFEVVDELGFPVAGAALSIQQREPHFPFGCAMNELIVENEAYQNWFLEKGFRYSVFENELKWMYNERIKGVEDYSLPDAMLAFAEKHGIAVRGHNVLWDDPMNLRQWQNTSSDEELRAAALNRMRSVANRYKGRFFQWDVINENMHFSRFSDLTNNGVEVYKLFNELDPSSLPFLCEYDVIEDVSLESKSATWRYLQKIQQLRDGGYDGPLGIGLHGHFVRIEAINLPYVTASIDMLHATSLPIWITEFDLNFTRASNSSAMLPYMEPLLRELHSHPYVDGMLLWAALKKTKSCYYMCLTDENYQNLPPGDILDKFMGEFIRVPDTQGITDLAGAFQSSLFLGQYEVAVTLPDGAQLPDPRAFTLTPGLGLTVVQINTSI